MRPDTAETARKRDSEMIRESLNTSSQSPHCQSGSGMLKHAVGPYSHSGMMDYPRLPITEWNLGHFPDSLEFQSWKVNFGTEDCLRTADPLLWIKEVEIAKSIDEPLTSRSIAGQHNFPDFDVLDAMIASTLKEPLNTQSNFRKKVSVKEQRAQKKCERLLRRETNCLHDLRAFPCKWCF